MKFGLWFEPEMVNKNSELFRKYPRDFTCSWNLEIHDYGMVFVLDYCIKRSLHYIYNTMAEVIRNSKISYIKWDMNCCLTVLFCSSST